MLTCGHLAISTLLQPPIIRTGLLPHAPGPSHRVPSARDIPPVTLTNIPHVEPTVFQPYLAQANSLYEALRRAKEGDVERDVLSRRNSRGDSVSIESFVHGIPRRPSGLPGLPKTEIPSSLPTSPAEPNFPRRRSNYGTPRRGGLTVAPLSTIPNVYFDEGFRLENPRTFDIVSERSEIVRPPTGPSGSASIYTPGKKALATNAILQEKLSWYMDTVEIHLISSISTASASFFAALGSLRTLHSEAAQSVEKIKVLREDLKKLDNDMAMAGLTIVAKRRRRQNMERLSSAVLQLQRIVESMADCEDQVDRGEVEEALRGLSQIEDLMAGRQSYSDADVPNEALDDGGQFIDLRSLRALDGASDNISFLRKRIGKIFEGRFIDTLLGDLRQHVDNVLPNATLQRWNHAFSRSRGNHARTPSEFPAYLQLTDQLRSALLVQLKGLARSDSVMPATVAYREAILHEFKAFIRRQLPSSSDDDAESTMSISTQEGRHLSQQEKSSILARNLRALEADDVEDMLKKIYTTVGEALRRLGTQVKVLLDITSGLGKAPMNGPLSVQAKSPYSAPIDGNTRAEFNIGSPVPTIQQEEIQQALDLSNLLGQAVDISQAQIVKILKVRTEQTTRLPLLWFLRYFTLNKLFADECEAISGRGGIALKTVVNAHIKEFVTRLGESERQHLVQSMDADRWDARDLTEEDTVRINLLLESSTKEVDFWIRKNYLWDNATSNESGQLQESNGIKERIRNAVVDEQKFILTDSALTLSKGIENFECLLTGIPSIAPDVSNFLLDYLKLFNSRSSQLILGAGATRSAGLKNITTKHLALSSQSLSFVIVLIPYIREFVRRHSSSSGSFTIEFDKVKRLYQEHQQGIHDKLVDIMTGRTIAHVASMKKLDWDRLPEGSGVNIYMETLIKESITLHKVMSKHLPESTVRSIMTSVLGSYRDQWGRAFSEVEVNTQAGKNRYGPSLC